jgi:hypothetical protein
MGIDRSSRNSTLEPESIPPAVSTGPRAGR